MPFICVVMVTTAVQLDEDDPLPVNFHHIDEAQDLSELPRQYAANQKAGQDHTQGPKANTPSQWDTAACFSQPAGCLFSKRGN